MLTHIQEKLRGINMQANQIPPPPPQTPPLTPPRRSRKKLWIVIGLVAVIGVALVAVVFLANPSFFALGETIPLTFSYNAGEKMTYSITMNLEGLGQNVKQTGTETIEVLKVEGDTFTIKTTVDTESSPSTSYTITIDKTGRITDYGNLPESTKQQLQSFSFLPGYGGSFPKQEAKVGDSWQIPLDTVVSSVGIQGTVNCKISEVKSLTVPAGTYNVFKLEITIDNAKASTSSYGVDVDVTMNANGYVYLEKGTGRTIELQFEETVNAVSSSEEQAQNMKIGMEMQLTNLVR